MRSSGLAFKARTISQTPAEFSTRNHNEKRRFSNAKFFSIFFVAQLRNRNGESSSRKRLDYPRRLQRCALVKWNQWWRNSASQNARFTQGVKAKAEPKFWAILLVESLRLGSKFLFIYIKKIDSENSVISLKKIRNFSWIYIRKKKTKIFSVLSLVNKITKMCPKFFLIWLWTLHYELRLILKK